MDEDQSWAVDKVKEPRENNQQEKKKKLVEI